MEPTCFSCSPLTLHHFFFPFSLSAPGSLQATRALMIVGIIVSIAGLGVACMGMKCTTCAGSDKLRKSRIAMTGGIILLVGGEEDTNVPLIVNVVLRFDQTYSTKASIWVMSDIKVCS